MSQQLFPPEIIDHTTEAHFAANNKPFHYIYLSILLIIIAGLTLLPVIFVDVTSQSRGVVRTKNENTIRPCGFVIHMVYSPGFIIRFIWITNPKVG